MRQRYESGTLQERVKSHKREKEVIEAVVFITPKEVEDEMKRASSVLSRLVGVRFSARKRWSSTITLPLV